MHPIRLEPQTGMQTSSSCEIILAIQYIFDERFFIFGILKFKCKLIDQPYQMAFHIYGGHPFLLDFRMSLQNRQLLLAYRTVLSNRSHFTSVPQTILFICFTSIGKPLWFMVLRCAICCSSLNFPQLVFRHPILDFSNI